MTQRLKSYKNDLPLDKYSLVRYISTVVEYRSLFDEEFYNKDLELTYEEIEEMIQERKINYKYFSTQGRIMLYNLEII